jgi:CRISPR-associated protein Csx16
MTTYFISRHAGAIEWAQQQDIKVDQQLSHFDPNITQKGDVIIGTLPINLVAEVNQRGGEYFHLTLALPSEMRGKELSANELAQYGATLEAYKAIKL